MPTESGGFMFYTLSSSVVSYFVYFMFIYSVEGTCSTTGLYHILFWRYYLSECLVIGVNHGLFYLFLWVFPFFIYPGWSPRLILRIVLCGGIGSESERDLYQSYLVCFNRAASFYFAVICLLSIIVYLCFRVYVKRGWGI